MPLVAPASVPTDTDDNDNGHRCRLSASPADIDFLRFGWGALMVNQFSENDPIWQNNKTVLENYRLKAR